MPAPPRRARLAVDLEPERAFLRGLLYRMTGSASDADDLVQEAFVRAMERPPRDLETPLRPWLVRVAMNLARDHLRRRKRRGYPGTWLPTPVESERDEPSPDPSPEARYGAAESASFAFLVALEELTPSQRAVLLLRDAFDFSSREAADALALSEENVRITLHRARKAMATYDRNRQPPGPETRAAVEAMLGQLLACLATHDLEGARALFAVDARSISDGGGLYAAAKKPVTRPERIVKLYAKLATKASAAARVEIRTVNGVPALVGDDPNPGRPNAPRFTMLIELDGAGRIRTLYTVLAPAKLGRVRFPGSDGAWPAVVADFEGDPALTPFEARRAELAPAVDDPLGPPPRLRARGRRRDVPLRNR